MVVVGVIVMINLPRSAMMIHCTLDTSSSKNNNNNRILSSFSSSGVRKKNQKEKTSHNEGAAEVESEQYCDGGVENVTPLSSTFFRWWISPQYVILLSISRRKKTEFAKILLLKEYGSSFPNFIGS